MATSCDIDPRFHLNCDVRVKHLVTQPGNAPKSRPSHLTTADEVNKFSPKDSPSKTAKPTWTPEVLNKTSPTYHYRWAGGLIHTTSPWWKHRKKNIKVKIQHKQTHEISIYIIFFSNYCKIKHTVFSSDLSWWTPPSWTHAVGLFHFLFEGVQEAILSWWTPFAQETMQHESVKPKPGTTITSFYNLMMQQKPRVMKLKCLYANWMNWKRWTGDLIRFIVQHRFIFCTNSNTHGFLLCPWTQAGGVFALNKVQKNGIYSMQLF